MSNLEHKAKMSPLQLSIILIEVCIGNSMISTTPDIVATAKESTWLSAIIGGIVYCSVTLLMVKLGNYFPKDSAVEYMPKLWGKFLGSLIIWWLLIIMGLMFSLVMADFSRTITVFLFDRTPTEVIALGMLLVCMYAALQDLGTILRLLEFLFFFLMPLFILMSLVSLINFQPENLLPLWPEDITGVLKASIDTWPIYNGFEFILLYLPFVYARQNKYLAFSVSIAFGWITLIYTCLVAIAIGVLSAQAIIVSPFPLLEVIRGVQIPGTFVERLEVYFLLIWIPITIDSYLMILWSLAQILTRHYKFADHRPFVLLLAPLLYTFSILMEGLEIKTIMSKLDLWLGLIFAFVIIPISLFLAWRQKRSDAVYQKGLSKN